MVLFMNMFLLDLGTQDLKNLRAQLYSAAEYFELSYTDDDQKHMYISFDSTSVFVVYFIEHGLTFFYFLFSF